MIFITLVIFQVPNSNFNNARGNCVVHLKVVWTAFPLFGIQHMKLMINLILHKKNQNSHFWSIIFAHGITVNTGFEFNNSQKNTVQN